MFTELEKFGEIEKKMKKRVKKATKEELRRKYDKWKAMECAIKLQFNLVDNDEYTDENAGPNGSGIYRQMKYTQQLWGDKVEMFYELEGAEGSELEMCIGLRKAYEEQKQDVINYILSVN